jgi:universal stress protein A
MAHLFRRILVPHDFSDHANDALRVAAELAKEHRGRLTVLHVLGPFYTGSGFPTELEVAWTPPPELLANLRERLEAVVKRVLGRRARGVVCQAVMGDPMYAIVDAARQHDSIVMSTLGRTGLSHLLIGSVAEKVVRHAPVPVLTIVPATRTRAAGKTRGASPRRPRR